MMIIKHQRAAWGGYCALQVMLLDGLLTLEPQLSDGLWFATMRLHLTLKSNTKNKPFITRLSWAKSFFKTIHFVNLFILCMPLILKKVVKSNFFHSYTFCSQDLAKNLCYNKFQVATQLRNSSISPNSIVIRPSEGRPL